MTTTSADAPPLTVPVPRSRKLAFAAAGELLENTATSVKSKAVRLQCGGCGIELAIAPDLRRTYSGDVLIYSDNNTISIVLFAEKEELVASIIESEHGALVEPEALKALAVTVRSFLSAGPRHSGAASFCDTTHCQVFQGIAAGEPTRRAVRETAGWHLTHNNVVFRPYYSRSCGGRTATFADVWGQASPDYPFPAVDCPCLATTMNWTTRLSTQRLALLTSIPNPRLALNSGLIEVAGNSQQREYSLENFRTLLGRTEGWKTLPSNRFQIVQEKNGYKFSGTGAGHGVGLCQQGIAMLAKQGLEFRAILSHYFPGTTVSSD